MGGGGVVQCRHAKLRSSRNGDELTRSWKEWMGVKKSESREEQMGGLSKASRASISSWTYGSSINPRICIFIV